MTPSIDILLPTYNGERFPAEQLESIIAQTHRNWRILARDDESSDGTIAVLEQYRAKLADRLVIIGNGYGNLVLRANFLR